MKNILGKENGTSNPVGIEEAYSKFDTLRVHLYGKREVRKGRKMGHMTACARTAEEAINIVNTASHMIDIKGDK